MANPIPPNVVPDQNRAPLVQPSRLWERVWFDWFLAIWKAVKASTVAGPNGSIQYNDNGVQAGDANLTWDKVDRVETVTALVASPIVATAGGMVALHPANVSDDEVLLGQHVDAAGDYIPNDTTVGGVFRFGDAIDVEIEPGQAPPTPNAFAAGIGMRVGGPTVAAPFAVEAYQYGGLGTGAVPGMILFADRNDSGSGAAGMLGGQLKDGRFFVIWMDATGAMRYNVGATLAAIRPTESGSVSDTSGFLFGSGGGSTTNITQLFTRRGEEGRNGIPGLPGAPGATGSTGATGPAGANGIIISRRADEGRAGIPGINGAAGVAGATGPAGQSAPVISRRGDDGRMGNPGPTGPTGATAATTRAITFAIDGGGSVLTTGVKAEQTIPYGCTITANTVLADQSGSVALDIKKSSFAGFPGSLASIVASAPPTLSSAQKSTDSTLTSWTTTITAGDVLQWSVSSVTTVTRVNCTLTVTA